MWFDSTALRAVAKKNQLRQRCWKCDRELQGALARVVRITSSTSPLTNGTEQVVHISCSVLMVRAGEAEIVTTRSTSERADTRETPSAGPCGTQTQGASR